MLVLVTLMMASPGSWITGSATSSTRTSRLPFHTTARMSTSRVVRGLRLPTVVAPIHRLTGSGRRRARYPAANPPRAAVGCPGGRQSNHVSTQLPGQRNGTVSVGRFLRAPLAVRAVVGRGLERCVELGDGVDVAGRRGRVRGH